MRALPNTNGSLSFSEASSENGFAELSSERKQQFKELIAKANQIPLRTIFKSYNISLDEYSKRCCCPFHNKHKNGRDGTPSFYFYPDTNTFHCFGCKSGRTPVDFISIAENIGKVNAAKRIIELYSLDIDLSSYEVPEGINYAERYAMVMDFSGFAREFYKSHIDNQNAIDFMDKICNVFDRICSRHNMSNDSIKSLIEKLKAKTEKYNQCHRY